MEAFEKSSGIRVKFIRFSSGEALAAKRITAEKNNPQIDVLFGGPVKTFTAGQESQGIFETLYSARRGRTAGALQGQGWRLDRDRRRSLGVHDQHAIPQAKNNLQAPCVLG